MACGGRVCRCPDRSTFHQRTAARRAGCAQSTATRPVRPAAMHACPPVLTSFHLHRAGLHASSVSMRGDHTRGPHIRSLRSASAVPCPASGRLASSARVHERRQCSGNRRYRLGDGWLRPRTTCTADQPTWLLRCWAHRQTYTAIIFICIHHTCFLKYSSYPVYTYRIYVEQLSWSVRVP